MDTSAHAVPTWAAGGCAAVRSLVARCGDSGCVGARGGGRGTAAAARPSITAGLQKATQQCSM